MDSPVVFEEVFLHFINNKACSKIRKTTQQWCSRDRNFRDWDLVKISRRDRDFIKKSENETRDLKLRPRPTLETSNFAHFAEFNQKCRHHFWLEFFFISGIFPTCFGCFLPANTTNKNRWILEILVNHFFAIFKVSRPGTFETKTESRPETFETETRKNGSRDRDQVSRLHNCNIGYF